MNTGNLRHVMLDLETFGTSKNAAIVSIGAVLFDPNQGIVGDTDDLQFHALIDVENSPRLGKIDPATVMWWLSQNERARSALVADGTVRVPLGESLNNFREFLVANGLTPKNKRDWRLWANDPDFDVSILMSAYEAHEILFPLSYGASRSMRTMSELSKEFQLIEPGTGITNDNQHDALADAIYQACVITEIKQSLRRRITPNLPVGARTESVH